MIAMTTNTDPNGELRMFHSQQVAGKVFWFHHHPASHYDAFIETENGFMPVEVKSAAIECGAPPDRQKHTHWFGDYLFGRVIDQQGD